jgi:hypothetical protein
MKFALVGAAERSDRTSQGLFCTNQVMDGVSLSQDILIPPFQ